MYFFNIKHIFLNSANYWIDKNNVYHINEQPANISSPPAILEPAIIIEDLSIDEQADERGYINRTAPPLRDFPPELQPKQ
jgi:hypothetical protein